jgi:hypothetical protein
MPPIIAVAFRELECPITHILYTFHRRCRYPAVFWTLHEVLPLGDNLSLSEVRL